MSNQMCVTIRKGKKEYRVWGVQSFEPIAGDSKGVCLYVNKENDSQYGVYFIRNCKVTEAHPTIMIRDVSQIENLK